MIPTRVPKRRFRLGKALRRILLPVVALAALAGAVMWPPSHKIIFNGKLKPMWRMLARVEVQAERPLHFIAQQQTITAKNREIALLNQKIDQDHKDIATRDQTIKALQTQLAQQQQAAAAADNTPGPAAAVPVAAAGGGAAAAGVAGPAAAGPGAAAPAAAAQDPDVKRAAAVWAQMDADSVASVVQQLPLPYVVRVLGQMSPDQVAEIMGALPPKLAAQITQIRQ